VVRRLLVRIGDTVKKGQLLAELETGELDARRAQAAAAVASARADLSYAEADLRRKRELAAAQLLPRSELDLTERASAVAAEQLRQAEANLDLAVTQLGYAKLTAPIAGVVASISTEEGETVAASFASPTFVTLLDLDRLEVRAYVDETDIGRIRAGQKASFTVDTYPGQEFAGEVVAVYPQAEIRDNVVNYVTVVRFQAPPGHTLRPEMTATVRIALETRRAVLAVPRRAVRREGGKQYVLLRRGDRTERRWVKTGGQDESFWEIADGLREGDEVLAGETKTEGKENAGP
jgi:RND family efflux transporter MFP subunit